MMGIRGPAPTPTEILKLRGSRVPERRSGEVQFEPGRPEPPAILKGEALAEWDRMVAQLDDAGILQKTDRVLLTCWCQTWAQWLTANTQLAKLPGGGLVIKGINGGFTPNPLVWIANAAEKRLLLLAAQFGFSAAARARITGCQAPDKPQRVESRKRG